MLKKLLIGIILVLIPTIAFSQVPNKAQWEFEMTDWGPVYCDAYPFSNINDTIWHSFYDRQRVMYQIGDYTGNSYWYDCAELAGSEFRDDYVIPANGGLPEQWIQTGGYRMDWERNGDTISRDTINLLRQQGVYCTVYWENITTPEVRADAVRSITNCLQAHLDADAVGFIPTSAQAAAKTGHIEALIGAFEDFFVTKNVQCFNTGGCLADGVPLGHYFIHPFIMSYASEILIRLYNETGDVRIPPLIQAAADQIWTSSWMGANPNDLHFRYIAYTDDGTPTGNWIARDSAPDLNMFMCPMYQWVFMQTGQTHYRDKADICFTGGVTQSLGERAPKQFNEMFRWSFQYVQWRESAVNPVINYSGALPDATVGVPYSFTIPVNWITSPASCSETAGNLPAGSPAFTSTAVSAGCLIEGTPTGAEVATFTELATATGGLTDSEAGLSITVNVTAPVITTVVLPNGVIGDNYPDDTVVCEGGTPPYTFTATPTSFCEGLSLNASTGDVIGGVLTGLARTCDFTITCTDDNDLTDNQAYSVNIAGGEIIVSNINPASTSATFNYGFAGLAYETHCEADVHEGTQHVEIATAPIGKAKRLTEVGLLTPDTTYNVVFRCGSTTETEQIFFTTTSNTLGAVTVPFVTGAPTAALLAQGAERLEIDCDDVPELSTPVSVQDDSCTTGCQIDHSLTAGIWYCRNEWKDASDNVLATGLPQPYPVEGATAPTSNLWVTAYYAGWFWDAYPAQEAIDMVDMSTLTHFVFGRYAPGAGTQGGSAGQLMEGAGTGHDVVEDPLIVNAHATGAKALAMLGGAGDGDGWVASTVDSSMRATFIGNILDMCVAKNYDGVDVDWEEQLDDSTERGQLIAFLGELRDAAILRARYQDPSNPFIITFPGFYVNTNTDLPLESWKVTVASLVDQYNVMTYAMSYCCSGWETWLFAPLTGHTATTPTSVESSIQAYVDAGIPRTKLGLGIGLYSTGYAPSVSGPLQTVTTHWMWHDAIGSWRNLYLEGLLVEGNRVTYAPSQTDYYYYPTPVTFEGNSVSMLNVETAQSIAAKGAWAKAGNASGVIIWTYDNGYINSSVGNPMMQAVKAAFK